MAWLHAVPDAPEGDTSKLPGLPRQQVLEDFGVEPELPPIDAQYLADHLFEIGPSAAGSMGPVPLSSQEVMEWQRGTGIFLQPWEFQLLRRLSKDYVSEAIASMKRGRPAPWRPEQFPADDLDLARRLEAAMDMDD